MIHNLCNITPSGFCHIFCKKNETDAATRQ